MRFVKELSVFLVAGTLLVGCKEPSTEQAAPEGGATTTEGSATAPTPIGETPSDMSDVGTSHTTAQSAEPVGQVTKAEGGVTVEEVYAKKAELKGKEVKIRGKVIKFNPGISGRNWIHLQDGTGGEGTNDLTVTTQDNAEVGKVVTITGKLGLDMDLGSGYKYPVIVEEATVKAE